MHYRYHFISFSLLILLVIFFIIFVNQRNHADENNKELITMDFEETDIKEIATFMSKITERNIVLDSDAKGKVSIIIPNKVTVEDAWEIFLHALDTLDLTAKDLDRHTIVYPKNKK